MRTLHKTLCGLAVGLLISSGSAGNKAAEPGPVPPPRLAATLDLGGAGGESLLRDVDGDGRPEAVVLSGGNLAISDASGRTLLDRFTGATGLVAVADLDGDGRAEAVTIDATTQTLAALDTKTGAARWRHDFPDSVALDAAYVRVADVDSTRPGLETIAFPDHSKTLGDANGYFFSASGELYARPVVKNVDGNQLNFPQMAIANVDAKGDPEVVVVGRPKLLVYDSGGRLVAEHEFRIGDPQGRHYGSLAVANLDADPELEAVVVVDRIWTEATKDPVAGKPQSMAAFDLVPEIRETWRALFVPGNVLETIPNGVADFDGDGAADVAVNRFDGTTQQLEIYSGSGNPTRAGQPLRLCARPDTFAWDARDLDRDGRPEFLTSRAKQERPSLSMGSRLAVVDAVDESGACRLEEVGGAIDGARYVTRSLRALGADDLASSVASDRTGVATVELPSVGTAFATYTESPTGEMRLQFRTLNREGATAFDAVRPGTLRAVDRSGLFLVAEGAGEEAADALSLYRWQERGLSRVAAVRGGGFANASPVAADLNGDGRDELIVRRPGRRISAYRYDPASGRFAEVWSADGNTAPVADETGAGGARVLVMAPSQRNRAVLVAYAADGTELWRHRIAELPASTKPDVVLGQFTGSGPLDAWVSAPREGSWLVDGATGKLVWESKTVFTYDSSPAVADVNRDGAQDLVVVANATYGVYSGRDGKPIEGPKDVRELGGDLFSTPILAPDGTMLLVSRGTLARAKVSGKKEWRFARKTERVDSGLLVGIARGRDGKFTRAGGNFGEGDRFVALDYGSGKVAFTTEHVPVTDVVAVDTNGDGRDEFVFGARDGRVVALDSETGAEAWAVDPGAFVSTPIVARLSGGLDLVVPGHDGRIRIYAFPKDSQG